MRHIAIIKALGRAALAEGGQDVASHQLTRLIAALRKEEDTAAADALQNIVTAAGTKGRAAPSRVTRSATSSLERMAPGVPVPVDPDSSAPLATVVFPDQNLVREPVFSRDVSEVISSLTREWDHQDALFAAGLRPSLTALVYGPPGTGKTTLALWFAKQLQLPAVVVRLDGLISSLLGTTARNLGALFDFANRYDCVLVLDEFDAIAKVRDDPNEVGEIKRVVNALLQNMDGRARTGITIGLTNHELLLDPAVWRRFEVQVPIPLPGPSERSAIISDVLRGSGATSAECKFMTWVSDGMSGAEITTACNKWLKRRIVDADTEASPADVILQAVFTTSARFQALERGRFTDRDELMAVLARDEAAHLLHGEIASLFGVSTKTVGRRVNDTVGGLAHA